MTYVPRDVINRIAACGINVKEWSGAETRAASQGGFSSLQGVIIHHTADKPPHGSSSWQYATFNNDAAPEYNFGIDADGTLNWLASGGVNSSGKGGPLTLQTGSVPTNGANYRLVAVSVDIDGLGEPSSREMIITAVVTTTCLLQWMGRQVGDCTAHKEYCGPGTTTPGRKIDPYGPWADGVYGAGLDWGPQQGRIDTFRSQLFWAWGDVTGWVAQQRGMTPTPPDPGPTPPDPGPGPTPPPAQPWYDELMGRLPTLTPGTSGWNVTAMQHLLAAAGFMNEANTSNYDGQFGNGTANALNNFKAAIGGSRDSTCDAWTWGALMHTADGIPTIVKGNTGADVKRMQHLLAGQGYMDDGNVNNYDGVWGNGTESAKVRFDNDKRLTPSPPTDCGARSWESLLTGQIWA